MQNKRKRTKQKNALSKTQYDNAALRNTVLLCVVFFDSQGTYAKKNRKMRPKHCKPTARHRE